MSRLTFILLIAAILSAAVVALAFQLLRLQQLNHLPRACARVTYFQILEV